MTCAVGCRGAIAPQDATPCIRGLIAAVSGGRTAGASNLSLPSFCARCIFGWMREVATTGLCIPLTFDQAQMAFVVYIPAGWGYWNRSPRDLRTALTRTAPDLHGKPIDDQTTSGCARRARI